MSSAARMQRMFCFIDRPKRALLLEATTFNFYAEMCLNPSSSLKPPAIFALAGPHGTLQLTEQVASAEVKKVAAAASASSAGSERDRWWWVEACRIWSPAATPQSRTQLALWRIWL